VVDGKRKTKSWPLSDPLGFARATAFCKGEDPQLVKARVEPPMVLEVPAEDAVNFFDDVSASSAPSGDAPGSSKTSSCSEGSGSSSLLVPQPTMKDKKCEQKLASVGYASNHQESTSKSASRSVGPQPSKTTPKEAGKQQAALSTQAAEHVPAKEMPKEPEVAASSASPAVPDDAISKQAEAGYHYYLGSIKILRVWWNFGRFVRFQGKPQERCEWLQDSRENLGLHQTLKQYLFHTRFIPVSYPKSA
jgi:hypothetical protein